MMNAHYRLKTPSMLLIGALLITSYASTRTAFKRGKRAEEVRNYDLAMREYSIALQESPGNIEFRLKFEQARFAAAFQHFENGRRAIERDDLPLAKAEFTRTLELDPTHSLAEIELARVDELIAARDANKPSPGRNLQE